MDEITTVHPEYTAMIEPWETVRDTMKGEAHIKKRGELYLPMTSGQEALGTIGITRYDNYKKRSRFLDIVAPAVRGLVGIAHEKPAFVEVPTRMQYILESATSSGDTLEDLARKITREVLQTGRAPLLVDAPVDGGEPYISLYSAEALINWKQDAMGYYLAVLAESDDVSEDEFGHEYARQFRVLRFTDEFGYTVQVYRETAGGLEMVEEYQIDTDAMPLAVAGSINTNASPDEPPVLPIARSAISAYMLSADYRQSLFMTGQPTPCTVGLGEKYPTAIGADTVWHLPEAGNAFFMEVSGAGIQLTADAIGAELERAEAHGSKLLQVGAGQESAEALKLRMLSQYATLQSVVMSAGEAIEQSLKSIAVWLNINPDEITYEPNTEFVRTAEIGQLSTINQAVSAGNLPKEVLYEATRQSGLTEFTDEELADMTDNVEPVM